jgi:demethoxyubiquinone hydroxylase (CLK1/Coq7/Cat5 family)
MTTTANELTLLNFYRASELHGGLVLGRVVQRARDPELILDLTRHSAEEIVHAQLWTETILALGGRPAPVRQTYQTCYAAVVGPPTTMLQVLALTQVFERTVYRHFLEHVRRRGTHPLVRATLRRMLEEEKGHLSWVKRWLDQQREHRAFEVEATVKRYREVDAAIYARLSVELGWRHAA